MNEDEKIISKSESFDKVWNQNNKQKQNQKNIMINKDLSLMAWDFDVEGFVDPSFHERNS